MWKNTCVSNLCIGIKYLIFAFVCVYGNDENTILWEGMNSECVQCLSAMAARVKILRQANE